jgi:tetratricopeptide (TPR) repeat protein
VPVYYGTYLQKTVWPENLAMPYAHETTVSVTVAVVWAVLLGGVALWALWRISSRPYLAVGWFWYLGTLVPVIGLVQVGGTPLADRFTYVPLIGLFMALAWGLDEMCVDRAAPKPVIIFLVAVMLAAGALRTRDQLGYWQNNETLLRHTLAVTKNNYTACINLGTWLSKKGQPVEAIDCFHQALQINPDDSDVLYNLGNACAKAGNWDEAISSYRHALRITPNQADVLDNLGLALVAKKQYAEAVTNFEAALKLNLGSVSAHNNLAAILFMEHRFKEAAQHYREALRVTPNNPQIHVNFGDALLKLGQTNDAVKNYRAALRFSPGDAKIHAKLQALGAETSK